MGAKKCGGEKYQKGAQAPTGVSRNLAAERWRTIADLLYAVCALLILFYKIFFY
jgi:hypothetical protein